MATMAGSEYSRSSLPILSWPSVCGDHFWFILIPYINREKKCMYKGKHFLKYQLING
jgi:hypothetical protein